MAPRLQRDEKGRGQHRRQGRHDDGPITASCVGARAERILLVGFHRAFASPSQQDARLGSFFAMTDIGLLAAALIGTVACSILSARRIQLRISCTQRLQYPPISARYEDEDGTATLASETAYSVQIHRGLVVCLSVLGCLASLVLGVITVQSHRALVGLEPWLLFAAWVCSDRLPATAASANRCVRLCSSFKQQRCSSSDSIIHAIDCRYSAPFPIFGFRLQ